MTSNIPKASFFRFENAWLHNTTFLPSIIPAWQQAPFCADTAGQLAACIKSTRAAAKVWPRRNRAPPTQIPNCKFLIQLFDFYEEMRLLSVDEFQAHRDIQDCLAHAIKVRATYWKHRSKHRAIRESDANIAFHHAQATARIRHNTISLVQVDGADIVNHEGKVMALTAYFKSIIGQPGTYALMDLSNLYDGSHIPGDSLTAPFTEEETKQALLSMN